MPEGREPSPTARRRRLAAELRRLRKQSGMTAEAVAKELRWGKTKPLYLESGRGDRPDPNDIELLCGLYAVSDELRTELVQLAIDGRMRGWWHPYSKMLSRDYTTYIGLEAEAAEINTFESIVLPGLLQTEEYARAVILGGSPGIGAAELDSRVTVRMQRQQILTGSKAAMLSAVVDEGAIRRAVGGAEVMRPQLDHLRELIERPNIELQVMPFRAGAHAAVAGPFTILRFADAADAPATYVESIAGELFIEESGEVEQYEDAFGRLQESALSVPDTISVIAAAAATI
jgi:transcriptional regulator with XRE-family HTH domain